MLMIIIPRYIDAFVKLMILSSVLHLTTIAIYFLMTHDTRPLNFFSIIGTDLLFPSIAISPYADIYSLSAIVILYSVLYFFFTHESRRSR
jgi:hypothetical protein